MSLKLFFCIIQIFHVKLVCWLTVNNNLNANKQIVETVSIMLDHNPENGHVQLN